MKTNGSSDKLQMEMGSIRRNLGEHTEQIIEDAREQLNWQHYVAKYPWAVLGVAAAAGYLLVPSRCHCQSTVHAATPPPPSAAHPANSQPPGNSGPVASAMAGVLGSVLAMVATTVAREGFATVSKLASEWWESAQQQSSAKSDNSPREPREPQL